jgi:hypothetical protein
LTFVELLRAAADQGAGVDEPGGALAGPAASTASGLAAAQDAGSALQAAAVRQIDDLIDGLVRKVPLGLIRERGAQGLADLLRAPPPVQTLLDELLQLRVTPYLALLRAGAAYGRPALSLEGWYLPVRGSLLRRTSRLIVAGLRPSSRAIARTEFPDRSKSAMTSRSSSARNRSEVPSRCRSSVIGA